MCLGFRVPVGCLQSKHTIRSGVMTSVSMGRLQGICRSLYFTTRGLASESGAASCSFGPWNATPEGGPSPPLHLIASRSYKAHRVNRPNLAQPIDVNTLDLLLARTTTPTSALLPVLKNLAFLNPRQTTYMLEKLSRMAALQAHRQHGSSSHQLGASPSYEQSAEGLMVVSEQGEVCRQLVGALGGIMAGLIADCSSEQLRRGLWGLSQTRSLTSGQR